MTTLAQRIQEALDDANALAADLARACGVKPPSVSAWLSGDTKSLKAATAIRAADFLGVNQLWLTEGRGPKRPHIASEPPNVYAVERRHRVPLISHVQAGDWAHATDVLQPGEAFEWIDTSVAVRPHTFALRVEGDSMEPEFAHGTILIVEPEMDALPGDYVIAKNGDNEATFKQLVRDGADLYLKPINPRYPIKPLGTGHIVGVVREAVKRYR